LSSGEIAKALRIRVQNRITDLNMVDALVRIQMARGSAQERVVSEGVAPPVQLFTDQRADAAYSASFQEIGLEVGSLRVEEAASIVRERSVGIALASALDNWALVRQELENVSGSRHLLAIARAADDDPWRNRLRDIALHLEEDEDALTNLAASAPIEELPPATVVRLGELLDAEDMTETAVTLLRRAQRAHPDDFWINSRLGQFSYKLKRWDEVVRFASAAIALRPASPDSYGRLGSALVNKGNWDEGVANARKAVWLNGDAAFTHDCLGFALYKMGERRPMTTAGKARENPEWRESEREYREAIRLDPEAIGARWSLGAMFYKQRRWEETISLMKKLIQLDPNNYWYHARLGDVYQWMGRWDDAQAVLQHALTVLPAKDSSLIHYHLAFCYRHNREFDKAVAELNEAIRHGTGFQANWRANMHVRLGRILEDLGDHDGAIAHFKLASTISDIRDKWDADKALRAQVAEDAAFGRWRDAADFMRHILALNLGEFSMKFRAAPLMAEVKDFDGYRRVCNDMLDRELQKPFNAEQTTKSCLLIPDIMEDRRDEILALARSMVEEESSDPWRYFVRGLAAYRYEEPGDARSWLRQSLNVRNSVTHHKYARANTLLLMAMVEQQIGQADEARNIYARAIEYIDLEFPALGDPELSGRWHDWLTCDILRREAGKTLGLYPGQENTEDSK
jgi:tetratricopeptide (TPR) repeat protein